MRIQFGTWIQSCDFVSNPDYGNTLGASTRNGYYTIVFDTEEEAYAAYKQLLEKGYYDATNNKYSCDEYTRIKEELSNKRVIEQSLKDKLGIK